MASTSGTRQGAYDAARRSSGTPAQCGEVSHNGGTEMLPASEDGFTDLQVNGNPYSERAGAGLFMAADTRIMSSRSSFAMPECVLGIVPETELATKLPA